MLCIDATQKLQQHFAIRSHWAFVDYFVKCCKPWTDSWANVIYNLLETWETWFSTKLIYPSVTLCSIFRITKNVDHLADDTCPIRYCNILYVLQRKATEGQLDSESCSLAY